MTTQYTQGKSIGINEYIHFEFLAVSQQYRGKNIAHNLVEICLENAIKKGYQRAFSTVTGPTSHHIHKKFGFQACFETPYETFSYEGQKPFASIAGSAILMDRLLT